MAHGLRGTWRIQGLPWGTKFVLLSTSPHIYMYNSMYIFAYAFAFRIPAETLVCGAHIMLTADSSCRDWEAVLKKKPADQDKGC